MLKNLICVIVFFVLLASCIDEPKETITLINIEVNNNTSEPSLHLSKKGIIYLNWLEEIENKNTALKFSTLKENNTWSSPKTIATGKDWFVNWADFPSITSFGENNLVAHFLDKSADDTYAYDVKLTVSNDNGNTWQKPFIPHKDNTPTEHGFVSKLAISDNSFLSVWLDGRQYNYAEKDSTIVKEMTLRSALIDDNGKTLNKYLIDNRVCDCCQTDIAKTNSGAIVCYRDRSENEIRDIYFSRFLEGKWTESQAVFNDNWNIAGCPVNGPSISSKNDTIAVSWFTMADNSSKVKVAFSNNDGETFNVPIDVNFVNPIGRVDIEVIDEKSALVSWIDIVNNETLIQLQRVYSNGLLGSLITVSKTSDNRSSGFPRLIIKDEIAYLTWTLLGDKKSVQIAKIYLNNIN